MNVWPCFNGEGRESNPDDWPNRKLAAKLLHDARDETQQNIAEDTKRPKRATETDAVML